MVIGESDSIDDAAEMLTNLIKQCTKNCPS